jgi:uncharacterized SAM-binding protein YcdF (DUF218 family)
MTARGALRLLGGVLVGLFAAVAFTPLSNLMHRAVVGPSPPPEPARAIVVLGAGTEGHGLSDTSLRRAIHGVTLVRRGLAPVLVMLGGPDENGGTTESDTRLSLARAMGVPATSLLSDGRGRTTREEASVCWELLAPRGAQKILLVTGGQHMPRASALFRQVGFEVVPAPVEELPAGSDRPQERLELARRLLRELVARAYHRAAGYI